MQAHPVANIFPPMSEAEYAALRNDIQANGQRESIWTWRGMVIDGRHRERACSELGRDCKARAWDGEESGLVGFVVSLNLHRRHLSESQRAMVAAGIATLEQGRPEKTGKSAGLSQPEAASLLNVSERLVRDAKSIQYAAPDIAQAVKSGSKTVTQAKRELKELARERRRLANTEVVQRAPSPAAAANQARFATIVVDPPWDWGDEGDVDQLGRARPTYHTMTIEELLALPVGERADDDAHLYLWITNRSLPKGFALLDAWGFRYVTCLTWCKPHFGMGNYFRGQTEHVLFGVKGSQQLKRKDIGTWFAAPRGPLGHSSKPIAFYDLVESCSPGPYLEMFARSERDGWTPWGGEIEQAAA